MYIKLIKKIVCTRIQSDFIIKIRKKGLKKLNLKDQKVVMIKYSLSKFVLSVLP